MRKSTSVRPTNFFCVRRHGQALQGFVGRSHGGQVDVGRVLLHVAQGQIGIEGIVLDQQHPQCVAGGFLHALVPLPGRLQMDTRALQVIGAFDQVESLAPARMAEAAASGSP